MRSLFEQLSKLHDRLARDIDADSRKWAAGLVMVSTDDLAVVRKAIELLRKEAT